MFKNIWEFIEGIRYAFLMFLEMRKPKELRDEEYIGILNFGSKERYHQYLDDERDRIKSRLSKIK